MKNFHVAISLAKKDPQGTSISEEVDGTRNRPSSNISISISISIHHPIKLGALFLPPKKFRSPLLFLDLPPVMALTQHEVCRSEMVEPFLSRLYPV